MTGSPAARSSDPRVRAAVPREAAPLLLFLFVAMLELHLTAIGADWHVVRAVTKPLLMPALAGLAWTRRAPRGLLAALACGWGGDILLEVSGTVPFLLGMAGFAAGHVCYLRLFAERGAFAGRRRAVGARCAAYGAMWAVLIVLLLPGLDAGMRVPVAAYSLLLTAMAAGAYGLDRLAALGGVLFLLSDTLIATDLADWPQLPLADLWVMVTYAGAQVLLVGGVLRARAAGGAGEPGAAGVTV